MSVESDLYRILSGKLPFGEGFHIVDPSFRIKKLGRKLYDEILDFYEDDILDDRQMQIMLMEYGMWTSNDEKKIKDLPKIIENAKVQYYKQYSDPVKRKENLNFVKMNIKEITRLSNIRYKYQYITLEGIASSAMWIEMINHMYTGQDKLSALSYYHNNSLSCEDIREIALSDEWAVYSALSKTPLSKSPIRMTDYQRRLLSWTNVYRNVRTHPDFPGDTIMADHLAFDGWMTALNRKEKAEKSRKVEIGGLKPNTRNVFFIGQANEEEFNEIMSFNEPEALRMVKGAYETSRS